MTNLANMRREYGNLNLDEKTVLADPMAQFSLWFEALLKVQGADPTAMVLSTVNSEGDPDSRVVLLKGIENNAFIFYTNYQSVKAMQLEARPMAALNFYWPEMARQVRIRGYVEKTSEEQSDLYFASRPKTSQLSAMASPQSTEIDNRQFLDDAMAKLAVKYEHKSISRPAYWGGYAVFPLEMEFWQGRDNRLHDRIHYARQEDDRWEIVRLGP